MVRAQRGSWHYQGVRNDEGAATTSAELRAHNLARLLRAVHEGAGQHTRAELTRQLGLARGTATVLVRELAGRRLIEERPGTAVVAVRGRPTGVPSPHPDGPVALAVDMREDAFTIAAFELTGRGTVLDRRSPGSVADLAARLSKHRGAFGGRLVGVGVAVPSPVADGKMLLTDGPDIAALLETRYVGNDATLAGLAEARRGVLRGVPVALHLHVATGIGGVLLTGGKPVAGAHDAAGEFGHMPLTGGGDEPCRCGASGCWELDVGARGVLRAAGLDRGDPAAIIASDAAAAAQVASALGRGIGALVNAHDPETVSVSGLAASLLAAAPDAVHQAYLAALMRFRRASPPALLPSSLGDLGTLTGAAELVFDGFLTARGLTAWAAAKTP